MKRYIRSARNYGITAITDTAAVIDSGYASNKQDFTQIKESLTYARRYETGFR